MGHRPSVDRSKLSTADKILIVSAALFVIDSFLPWQRLCSEGVAGFPGECLSFSLWGGDASIIGVLAGLLAILVLGAEVLIFLGISMPVTVPASTVSAWLAFGTALFAVLKFLMVVTNDVGYAAVIGFLLAVALAYGGWMKLQEPSWVPQPPAIGGTSPPPPTGS